MTGLVGACLGTYQRRAWLEECLGSARAAARGMPLRFYVADGGSTDGTLEMLKGMPDVHLIEQGELLGAVAAFDAAYGAAVDDGADWIGTLNDDLTCVNDPAPIITAAVLRLAADPSLGGVAFASDRYATPAEPDPFFEAITGPREPVTFRVELHHGRPYLNQGIVRRAAHMAAARAQGDPAGRDYWDRRYHTYGADGASGCWLWRLGWRIEAADDLRVRERMHGEDDAFPGESGNDDPLRLRNGAQSRASSELFASEWWSPASLEYDRAAAERFGGRLL